MKGLHFIFILACCVEFVNSQSIPFRDDELLMDSQIPRIPLIKPNAPMNTPNILISPSQQLMPDSHMIQLKNDIFSASAIRLLILDNMPCLVSGDSGYIPNKYRKNDLVLIDVEVIPNPMPRLNPFKKEHD